MMLPHALACVLAQEPLATSTHRHLWKGDHIFLKAVHMEMHKSDELLVYNKVATGG